MNTARAKLRDQLQIGEGKTFPIPFSSCDNAQNPFGRSL
jgi:hypothetical protein